MKIFFEEYNYDKETMEKYNFPPYYTVSLKNQKVIIPYVGYFFSPDEDDSYFILPKVFVNIDKNKDEKAFGQFIPEEIIDTSSKDNPLKYSDFRNEIFSLSTWIYRAIANYKKRCFDENITGTANIQNVISINGDDSETSLDIILKLILYNNKHKNLFTSIAKLSNKGENKINWRKTIARKIPFFQANIPVYLDFINKNKTINFDETLIVLFYSVLDYLQIKYNFHIIRNLNYKTNPRYIKRLIETGKGCRLLRSIRKKYFKDELVELWKLLLVFFKKAESIARKHYHEETLLVRNFNMVFEDMIDSLISDNTKDKHKELKDQLDGKIVDHIFSYESLISHYDKIYYIGDSKYYKEGDNPSTNSIYKQYTYARNVIQFNMNIVSPAKGDLGRTNYFDEETEGYNITPNFFIRGIVDPKHINYVNDELKATLNAKGKPDIEKIYHHENRLFDRDTLIVQKYNINFLYVLSSYVLNNNNKSERTGIQEKFRKNLLTWLQNNYRFWILRPRQGTMKTLLRTHFKDLIGKVYKSCENYYLALDCDERFTVANKSLSNSLSKDFELIEYCIIEQKVKQAQESKQICIIPKGTKSQHINVSSITTPKLGWLMEDKDVSSFVNNMITSQEDTTILKLLAGCQRKFGEKYPSMSGKDWYHLIRDYINWCSKKQEVKEVIKDDEIIPKFKIG